MSLPVLAPPPVCGIIFFVTLWKTVAVPVEELDQNLCLCLATSQSASQLEEINNQSEKELIKITNEASVSHES